VTDTGLFAPAQRASALPGWSVRMRRFTIGDFVIFDPVAQAVPAMRPGEIALLRSVLSGAHSYLEFGAGGSTVFALRQGVGNVVSVESDVAWIERLHADPTAAEAVRDSRLHLLHADIGAISGLGRPVNEDARTRWPSYARAPWPHVQADRLDVVLIDGRFRVACILETALRCSEQTSIVIHDFWNRPDYHVVLPFLTPRTRNASLGVFGVKAGLDREAAAAVLAAYAYVPG
jgi:hypothetical protein